MTMTTTTTRLSGTHISFARNGEVTIHSRGASGIRRQIEASLREALDAEALASEHAALARACRPTPRARPLGDDRLDEVAAVLDQRAAARRSDAALARAALLEAALYNASRDSRCAIGFTKETT